MSTAATNGSTDPCRNGCKRKFAVIACPSCHQLALSLVGLQTCGSDDLLSHEHLNTIVQKDFFASDVPVKICGTCRGNGVTAQATEWSASASGKSSPPKEQENENRYDLFTSDSSSETDGSEYDGDGRRYYDDESDCTDDDFYGRDDPGLEAIPEEDEGETDARKLVKDDQDQVEIESSEKGDRDQDECDEDNGEQDNLEDETDEDKDANDQDENPEPPSSAASIFPPMFHEDSNQSFPYIPEGPPPLEDLIFSDDEDWNQKPTDDKGDQDE